MEAWGVRIRLSLLDQGNGFSIDHNIATPLRAADGNIDIFKFFVLHYG